MKTEGQIKQKLKQVLFRHKKGFLQEHLKVCPENCIHNKPIQIPLASRLVGFCHHPQQKDPTVCDSYSAIFNKAEGCPLFTVSKEAESLKQDFQSLYEDNKEHLGLLAEDYPDLAALLWVLGGDDKDD